MTDKRMIYTDFNALIDDVVAVAVENHDQDLEFFYLQEPKKFLWGFTVSYVDCARNIFWEKDFLISIKNTRRSEGDLAKHMMKCGLKHESKKEMVDLVKEFIRPKVRAAKLLDA